MERRDALLRAIAKYIEENLKSLPVENGTAEPSMVAESTIKYGGFSDKDAKNLEDLIGELGETFHEMLFRKIMESGKTDAEIYKRANIDRKFFSKIRNNPAYHPRKGTVLALAIALNLTMEDTVDLLAKAEYALSPGSKGDLIVKYFIEREIYDIQTINYALYEFGQPMLGG